MQALGRSCLLLEASVPVTAVTRGWAQPLKVSWGTLDGSPFPGAQACLRAKVQQCHPPEHEMGERRRNHTDPHSWRTGESKSKELEIQPTSKAPSANREPPPRGRSRASLLRALSLSPSSCASRYQTRARKHCFCRLPRASPRNGCIKSPPFGTARSTLKHVWPSVQLLWPTEIYL